MPGYRSKEKELSPIGTTDLQRNTADVTFMMPTIPFLEILRTASQALLRNWGRAVLTSLSMVVGTASLVLVVVAGISGRAHPRTNPGVGSNLITIYHETDDASARSTLADRLNMEDLEAIRREIPGHEAQPLSS